MWNELGETGSADKDTAIIKLNLPDAYGACYACESDIEKSGGKGGCLKCPVIWGNNPNSCGKGDNPYTKWEYAETPRTRKKYAKIIANLKWINRRGIK
jgi:hypothetical protein